MKKFLLILTVTVVALCLAAPAMADLKLTTTGYMDVTGINVNNNVIDRNIPVGVNRNTNDSANSWYNMELIIEPTLHINDKVRIHSKVTIMEKNWGSNMAGTYEQASLGAAGNTFDNYRGAHNFWWEHLYMSFPLLGGTMYVGRMSGGTWGSAFMDDEDNRDRIKYVRKFGHIVLLGVIEQFVEADGGTPLNMAQAADGFDTSHGDTVGYAFGGVIPFSKNIIYKPVIFYYDRQGYSTATLPTGFKGNGMTGLFAQDLMVKTGPFKLLTEADYRWTDREDAFINPATGRAKDWDEGVWSWWLDASFTFGPAEIAAGFFWLEGTDSVNPWENKNLWGLGGEFQPLYLFTSEDCGLLFDASGLPNGSAGTSGVMAYFLRGAYKISDTMKIDAILAYVEADEMVRGSHYDGVRAADDEFGWEFDINFEWKFMPNIKYVAGFAYLDAGDYFSEVGGTTGIVGNGVGTDISNNVWALHHALVINW
jgi:hypothetical protein